jgi:hypothetical protein
LLGVGAAGVSLDDRKATRMRHLHSPVRLNVLAIAACSLLVAACGSAPDNPPTDAGQGRGQLDVQAQQAMLRFTNCMRNNGVPSFQDPAIGGNKTELAPGTAHSPAFVSAYQTCQNLMPGGGPNDNARHSPAQIAGALAFARCLRSHGFLSFPDPTTNGQLTHEMVAAAGISLHQPAVLQAGDACVGVSNGFITRAMVARFVAGH